MKSETQILSEREEGETENEKLPYATPVLNVFGSVKQLTEGGGGSATDGGAQQKPHTFSDRLTKENIVRVGTHPLDIGLYLFDYKPAHRNTWGHGRQFGVMADEVERVMPEAVTIASNGYKAVDYTRLGIRLERH